MSSPDSGPFPTTRWPVEELQRGLQVDVCGSIDLKSDAVRSFGAAAFFVVFFAGAFVAVVAAAVVVAAACGLGRAGSVTSPVAGSTVGSGSGVRSVT